MPRNVEIKAVISNFSDFVSKAKQLSGSEGLTFGQVDTFFEVPDGRLKLREQQGQNPMLIAYDRADENGPKLSDFEICDLPLDSNIKSVLSRALPTKGILIKSRTLFMVGQTRVHVDRVENLGDFMELEVQLTEEQSLEDGERIAKNLMKQLGVSEESLVKGAYLDHVLNKK